MCAAAIFVISLTIPREGFFAKRLQELLKTKLLRIMEVLANQPNNQPTNQCPYPQYALCDPTIHATAFRWYTRCPIPCLAHRPIVSRTATSLGRAHSRVGRHSAESAAAAEPQPAGATTVVATATKPFFERRVCDGDTAAAASREVGVWWTVCLFA